jgi:hypothetical protein
MNIRHRFRYRSALPASGTPLKKYQLQGDLIDGVLFLNSPTDLSVIAHTANTSVSGPDDEPNCHRSLNEERQ